jgi:hypothetical protein
MFFINTAIQSKERYDLSKFMQFTVDCYDPLNGYFINRLKSLQPRIKYNVQTDEHRPDRISKKVYGTPFLFWIVMLYNDIYDPDEIVADLTLQLPSQEDLNSLFFRLKSLQSQKNATAPI